MSRFKAVVLCTVAAGSLLLCGGLVVRALPLRVSSSDPAAALRSSETFPPTGKIYEVGKGVTPPRATHSPEPAHTPQAKKAHRSGAALFSVVVDAKGNVTDVKETSKPIGLGLDESAIKTLRTWKFQPAEHNGKPVAVRVDIEVTFRID